MRKQLARKINKKLDLLHSNLFQEGNPIPVKWALRQMGLIETGIRLPLVELGAKYHIQVIKALKQAGIELSGAVGTLEHILGACKVELNV